MSWQLSVTCIRTYIKNRLLLFPITVLAVISTQSTAADIISGGLGLSEQVWQEKQGKPDTKCPGDLPIYTCYSGGKYRVVFMDNYIQHLDIHIYPSSNTSKTTGISLNESRSLSKRFIPVDGRLVKTYKNQSGSTVDLYMSESLKSLDPYFSYPAWSGGEIGNFIVIHSGTDRVKRIVIGLGNNP